MAGMEINSFYHIYWPMTGHGKCSMSFHVHRSINFEETVAFASGIDS